VPYDFDPGYAGKINWLRAGSGIPECDTFTCRIKTGTRMLKHLFIAFYPEVMVQNRGGERSRRKY
jgi:hypothetical protein